MKESGEFRKLLEKYKWGQATAEEKAVVEKELEKAEAIQEYLFELEELPVPEHFEQQEEEASASHVRRLVRRRWLKHGVITGVLIFLVLIGGWSIGRPLLDKLFFDPTEGRTEKTYSEYELYKMIENNISIGGYALEAVHIEQMGIGTYVLSDSYYDVLKNETRVQVTTLKKGKIESQPLSVTYENPMFSYMGISTEEMFGPSRNQELDDLKEKVSKLPETAVMKVKLYFDSYKEVNLETVKELVLDQKLSHVLTAGIASSSLESGFQSSFGIRFNGSYAGYGDGRHFTNMAQVSQLNKEYPSLLQNGNVMINSAPEKLEQHYRSMLNYLLDNKELGEEIERIFNPMVYTSQSSESQGELSTFVQMETYNQQLEAAKRYVEEHGVVVADLTVLIHPDEFNALIENELVSMIGIEGVELINSNLW
ncbi:hypothetical protein I6N96_05175 [Enterococcus sp. BWM-S5]|uniref:Sigma factor regulator C-terminal domain-containing protein n=1 Tax=Enterococcus larvae TaxID=2794352 RepID=A0ABS4CGC2_9ENTE|nr:hypothetical protein [Enterococcus larvae]MBP1045661.1 hypothetical protein [Enterococcus larvae]